MVALLSKIIQALAAALPALVAWWEHRQAAKAQAEAKTRVADIRRDPGAQWVRAFGGEQPGTDTTAPGQAGTDQPDADK